jgi:glycosyltransferase involved in cell wall biosynthesis
VLVSVKCLTYNHAPFIRECLDGILMQKTDFRFEVVVHDDASTDGTIEILKEYEECHPDVIRVIYEEENQFALGGNMDKVDALTRGKYWAVCEGDDYWTDPLKLQKQVEVMEAHPDCMLVCNRTLLYSLKNHSIVGENYCYHESRFVSTKDIIYKGGLFISTCSILFRPEVKRDYPDYCRHCEAGDYSVQLMAAMKGRVYYMDEPMSVYRIDNPLSWVGKLTWNKERYKERIILERSRVNMLKGFAQDYPRHAHLFKNKIANHINRFAPGKEMPAYIRKAYQEEFAPEIRQFSIPWRIDHFVGTTRLPLLWRIRKWYYPHFRLNIKRY